MLRSAACDALMYVCDVVGMCGGQTKEVLEGDIDEDPVYPWPVQLSRYMRRPNVVLDILAVLPLAICLIVYTQYDPDTIFLNVARILQLVKLIQFQKNRRAVSVITRTVLLTYKTFLFMFWCILLVVLFVGAVVFALERGVFTVNDDYPDGAFLRSNVRNDGKEVSPFTSLGVTLYWVVVSVTTVGYGDIVPTTSTSRAICSILFLLSILILSLPVSVIGESFGKAMEQYNAEKRMRKSNILTCLGKGEGQGATSGMSTPGGGRSVTNPLGRSMSHTLSTDSWASSFGGGSVVLKGAQDGSGDGEGRGAVAMTSVSRVPFKSTSRTPSTPKEKQEGVGALAQVSSRDGAVGVGTSVDALAEQEWLAMSWETSDALNEYRAVWDRCSRVQLRLLKQHRSAGSDSHITCREEYREARAAVSAAHERMNKLLVRHDKLVCLHHGEAPAVDDGCNDSEDCMGN